MYKHNFSIQYEPCIKWCTLTHVSHPIKTVNSGPVFIRNPNLVITVSANVPVPTIVGQLASAVLLKGIYISFVLLKYPNAFPVIRCSRPKWPTFRVIFQYSELELIHCGLVTPCGDIDLALALETAWCRQAPGPMFSHHSEAFTWE